MGVSFKIEFIRRLYSRTTRWLKVYTGGFFAERGGGSGPGLEQPYARRRYIRISAANTLKVNLNRRSGDGHATLSTITTLPLLERWKSGSGQCVTPPKTPAIPRRIIIGRCGSVPGRCL